MKSKTLALKAILSIVWGTSLSATEKADPDLNNSEAPFIQGGCAAGSRFDNNNGNGDFNGQGGFSSYQGTTTGPGPNGGYPGTPRGNYRTTYQQQTEEL